MNAQTITLTLTHLQFNVIAECVDVRLAMARFEREELRRVQQSSAEKPLQLMDAIVLTEHRIKELENVLEQLIKSQQIRRNMVDFKVCKKDRTTTHNIKAENAREAAELFVEAYEIMRADFPVGANNDEMSVIVTTPSGMTYGFTVTGELRPVYHATPADM